MSGTPGYEELLRAHDAACPERFNFARDVFDPLAEDPERLALWWVGDDEEEARQTFAELAQRSRQAARALADLGVGAGEVVVVILPRIPEWWVVNLACLRLGAILSPAPTQLSVGDIRFRLQASEAVCVIADDGVAGRVDEAAEGCPRLRTRLLVADDGRPGWSTWKEAVDGAPARFETIDSRSDDPALLYFTSGTTGHPKMTLHTHVSYPLRHKVTGQLWLDLRDGDVHWNLSDTGWAKAGWSSVYGPWNQGATVFTRQGRRFDPVQTLETLRDHPIDVMCAAPTVYRMLVLEELESYDFAALRHCVAAGEPLNPEVIERWKEATGITIRDGYGQTETSLLVGSFPCLEPRPGSMGKPAPGFDVQVIDDAGEPLPAGEEGDIAVRVRPRRPVGLFKEYWHDPERTAAAYRGDWYVTGDRGVVDDDGYFWFVGRADDVMITSGYRIGPFEIESALLEHPAVAESAVVSSPDEVRGEVVKAFVVLKEGWTGSDELVREIQESVKRVTAPYKYPRKVEFVEELPKTVSGKIRRTELRAAEWEGRRGPGRSRGP